MKECDISTVSHLHTKLEELRDARACLEKSKGELQVEVGYNRFELPTSVLLSVVTTRIVEVQEQLEKLGVTVGA